MAKNNHGQNKPGKDDCSGALNNLRKLLSRWVGEILCAIGRLNKGHFDYTIEVKTKTRKAQMLEIKITNEQKVNVTISPVTATGKPAKLDGVPTWEVTTGASTIVVAEDGLSADLVSSDDPGDTQILVKADANLGEGVEEISDIITLSVSGSNAANLGLKAGEPVAK